MAKRVIHFDRATMNFVGITEQIRDKLVETYPWVNLDFELNKMCLWLISPKGTRRQGTLNFIMGWLSNVERPKLHIETLSCGEDTSHLQVLWNKADWLLKKNSSV